MVTTVPCDDRDKVGQRARRLRCGKPDRMAAVDEAYTCANRGVMMRHRDIEDEAGEFRRRRDDVAAGNLEDRAGSEVREMYPVRGSAKFIETPSSNRRAHRVGIEFSPNRVEVVVASGIAVGVAQREHRAAKEIQNGAAFLVLRAHPQRGESGGGAAGTGAVLAQSNDFGRRVQAVADAWRAMEHEAAIEEIRDHAMGDEG